MGGESDRRVKKITIVSGTFNEAENIGELYSRVSAAMQGQGSHEWDMVLIDNCSSDGTPQLLRDLAARDKRIKVILNARNYGHIRSGYHAMMQCHSDAVLLLCSDLQDPPEMIPEFIRHWEQGAQAVVGVKASSEESPLFFMVRRAYYSVIGKFSDTEIIKNFTGFGLYDQSVISYCRAVADPYPYFRGMISEMGAKVVKIPYRQPARKRGITSHNFYTLFDLAMLGITKHSKVPLRLATMSGFALSILSLLTGLGYLIYKLLFWDRFSAGMAPVVIGLFLFCSVQLFFIGILGEYIGVILTHVRKLPLVVEKERINF